MLLKSLPEERWNRTTFFIPRALEVIYKRKKSLPIIKVSRDLLHLTKNKNPYISRVHNVLYGAPDTIRTYDLQFRKLSLYPAELRARDKVYYSMNW